MLLTSPPIAVPPVAAMYHRYCPLVPPEALSVILAGGQALPPVVVGNVGSILTNNPASVVNTGAAKSPLILQR